MIQTIIALIIVIGIIVAIVLSIHIEPNQPLKCPYCDLEFASDLFLFQENALVQCPFCQKWMTAQKVKEKYRAKRIFHW